MKKQHLRSLSRRGFAAACLVTTLIPAPSWSAATTEVEKRYALLIANTSYPDEMLPSRAAANDAYLLKGELERAGFDVDLRENAAPDTMKQAMSKFNAKITAGAVAMIYFAGFGAQVAQQDYMLPVKVILSTDADIRENGVGIEDELVQLDRAGARVKIAILDAAYPRARAKAQGGALGLAPINGPSGTLALLSERPGRLLVANDVETSPFMGELIKELRRSSGSVEDAFMRTRSAVSRASNSEEVPWVASSLADKFSLHGSTPASAEPTPPQASPTKTELAGNPQKGELAAGSASPGHSNDSCDRLAASPLDTTRPPGVAGVLFEDIDSVNAVTACRSAHQADPNNMRITIQLARALEKAGDPAAVELYETAAAAGLSLAMNNLGVIYQRGLTGQTKDYVEATRWFRRAADAGLPLAMRSLAWMYVNGNGVPKDDAQALWWFRRAVAGGDADAMNTLGWRYEHGVGVTADESQALELYQRAADGGNSDALCNMAVMYTNGHGVVKDEAQAADLYRKAIVLRNRFAMNNLGKMYEMGIGMTKDEAAAARLYRQAADAGYAPAMDNLGRMYKQGEGVDKSATEAVRWYHKGADSNDGNSMNDLAIMYATGNGTTKDETEAIRWCRAAANGGNSFAMHNLGAAYAVGTGVAPDNAEAVRWYLKAAEAGNTAAMDDLGTAYQTGKGVTLDEAEAVRWFRKAADAGDRRAMHELARAYTLGLGVAEDHNEADRWSAMAAGVGDKYSPAHK